MAWKCQICGLEHRETPLCFGFDAPWGDIVPENEFIHRVELTADQCVVDKEHFFIRGHVNIPILNYPESFTFSVWSSLSEQSFQHMCDHWEAPRRASDPPYFGWLCTQ